MRMTGKRKSLIYSVPNTIFQKLNQTHLTHTGIIEFWPFLEVNEYDRLYELQNYFDGEIWTEFKNRSELECSFFKDLKLIDQHDITCLWFFRDRSDHKQHDHITIENVPIKYRPNTVIITNKQLNIADKKDFTRPCVQFDWHSVHIETRKRIKNWFKRIL